MLNYNGKKNSIQYEHTNKMQKEG